MSDLGLGTVLDVVTSQCAAEDMGDEIVALNVDTGIYFSMRDLGAALWRDLAAGHSVERLAGIVRNHSIADDGVHAFVRQILEHGLMREAARPAAGGQPGVDASLASGKTEIILEIYEDMKDLILSDPIHDVDETIGWPKQMERAP